jgi:hypothetical protein
MEGYYFTLGGEILGFVCPTCGGTLTTTAHEDEGYCEWDSEIVPADNFVRDGQTAEAQFQDWVEADD